MMQGFTSLMGRLLIIPIASSGVCLSMLFGVPMAGAMTADHTMMTANDASDHAMVVVENQDQGPQPTCCAAVRMEHDTKATAPNAEKTPTVSLIADVPKEVAAWKFEESASAWAPPNSFLLHQPFSLTGVIFKRE